MQTIVLGRFPPPLDGQAVATERLASLLDPHGSVVRMNIASPDNLIVSDAHLSTKRIIHAIRTYRYVRNTLRDYPIAPLLWPAVSASFLGHLRDRVSILSALNKNQPVFAIVHLGRFPDLFKQRLTRRSGLRFINRMTGIIFLSKNLADQCAQWIPDDKRIVIPNTIIDEVICSDYELATRRAARKDRNNFRLLFLSNMITSKGYDDVLEAVRILKKRSFPIVARFAGRWPDDSARNNFFRKRTEYGLADTIEVLGTINDRRKLKELYLWADAFALPTYYPVEAQPLTLIEAMNAGTPVITTQHSGIPEMLGDDEGIFIPPKSPEAIADAVQTLDDCETWQSKSNAARKRFEDVFSPEVVARQWLDLLETVR